MARDVCKHIFGSFPDLNFIGMYNAKSKSFEKTYKGTISDTPTSWVNILLNVNSGDALPNSLEILISKSDGLIIRQVEELLYVIIQLKREDLSKVNSFLDDFFNNETQLDSSKQKEMNISEIEQIDATQFIVEKTDPNSNGNHIINEKILEAQRMQQMILPDLGILERAFTKHFLLYQPKDLIGGDFYWIKETGEDEMTIVVADCTGHSLEGAMASMTVHSIINQVFANEGTLREKLISIYELLQEYGKPEDDTQYSLGVELAILKFSFNWKRLHFLSSGVKCIISDGFQTKLLRGKSMNKFEIWKQTLGTEEIIDVEPGQWVCAFTDGITDQFDTLDDKKLGHKGLTHLIEKNTNLSCNYFENEFKTWRGNNEPYDDMTLLGLQI